MPLTMQGKSMSFLLDPLMTRISQRDHAILFHCGKMYSFRLVLFRYIIRFPAIQMKSKMERKPSHFGFDNDRSLSAKLGRTFLLLVLAGFLLIFTVLAFGLNGNLWWRIPAHVALEVCWTFWLLALIENWWAPQWLHRLFLHAESRMVWLVTGLKWFLCGLFVAFFVAGILLILGVFVI
jgi:hypothetical protein